MERVESSFKMVTRILVTSIWTKNKGEAYISGSKKVRFLFILFHHSIRIFQISGNYYEGEFWNSKRHGFGIFISSDGSTYEGSFAEGLQSGYGILKKKDN